MMNPMDADNLIAQGRELPKIPNGTEGELVVYKIARAISQDMFCCQVWAVRPVEWECMIERDTGALKAGNCLAYFTDENEANRYAATRNAFSALLDLCERQKVELAQAVVNIGKTAIIAITLNGILGDLMDYLDKQGITTLPNVFVQRVDAVHEKVMELAASPVPTPP